MKSLIVRIFQWNTRILRVEVTNIPEAIDNEYVEYWVHETGVNHNISYHELKKHIELYTCLQGS